MPQIAVHLVTYNSADTIEYCLNSLLAQHDANFEALVIDNASTDDTVQRVEKMNVPVLANHQNVHGYARTKLLWGDRSLGGSQRPGVSMELPPGTNAGRRIGLRDQPVALRGVWIDSFGRNLSPHPPLVAEPQRCAR